LNDSSDAAISQSPLIWFAAGMNFPIMVLGLLAVSYGLSFTSSVTAIVAVLVAGPDEGPHDDVWSYRRRISSDDCRVPDRAALCRCRRSAGSRAH
jgi:hypothetical protein